MANVVRFIAVLFACLITTQAFAYDVNPRLIAHFGPKPNWYYEFVKRIIGSPTPPRNILLVAGIPRYDLISPPDKEPPGIDIDIKTVTDTFTETQGFDEVITLRGADFEPVVLESILTKYLPDIFRAAPKSRFVFAFSGHGFVDDHNNGYLLLSNATNLRDKDRSIPLAQLKKWLGEITKTAFQSLVLINACQSGSFFYSQLGAEPVDMFHEGHWVLTSAGPKERAPAGDGSGAGTLFYNVFKDAIVRGRAAQSSKTYVNFLEFANYMRREISSITELRVVPTNGGLYPGGWQGSFVFKIGEESNLPKLVKQAERANSTWKALGEREFVGQIRHIISPAAFDSPTIIAGSGWFDRKTLVNALPFARSARLPMVQSWAQHIVIGATQIIAGIGEEEKGAVRSTFLRNRPRPFLHRALNESSVHFVVYRDAAIDQFVSLLDQAQAVGNGNGRGIDNRNVVALWLDNAGPLSRQVGDLWFEGNGSIGLNTAHVIKGIQFAPVNRARPENTTCLPAGVGATTWERYRLGQLEAAESVIDQVVRARGLRRSRDTVLAASEVRCDYVAPGPQLNPWILCLKKRVEQGRSVGGCARENILDGLIQNEPEEPEKQEVSGARVGKPSGIFRLNLAESKYKPGPGPRTETIDFEDDGLDPTITEIGIDAAGKPMAVVFANVSEDDHPHSVTGSPDFDASSFTRVDFNSVSFKLIKSGEVVQSGLQTVSADGKSVTISTKGSLVTGEQIDNVQVYEKQ